ncbi:MAG: aldo/keto reductase, partial [Spirochaetota bacterium]
TGKYAKGVPEGSRLALKGYEWLRETGLKQEKLDAATRIGVIAKELGATGAQLAIAFAAANPRVSTVITGASRPEQVEENMKAFDLLPRIDAALLARLTEATREANDLP